MIEQLLPDVCDIQYGYAFDSAQFSDIEGIPLVRIRDVVRGFSETKTTESFPEEFIVNNGDMLIGMDGEFNISKWQGGRAALNQRVCRLIPKKIVTDYLFHFMPTALKKIEEKTPFVTVKHLSAKELNKILVPYPTIEKQEKIAYTLNNISNLISLRKKQLQTLDDLVKARFVEMFGMPGTDIHNWGLLPLGTCCEMNPKKGSDARLTSGLQVSFVPMPAVSENGAIDASEVKTYDEVKTGFTYFAENDVLFAKITPCMENGKGAVAVGLTNGIGFGSTEFHVLRPIVSKSNPYWLYTLMSFDSFRKDAAANMTGSAGQRRVPASFLERYKVSLPPIDLQEQFAAFVSRIDKSKLSIQQGMEKQETLKKSLMQQYFG